MDTMAVKVDLNTGWEFCKGSVSRAWLSAKPSDGERVDLPHCWNAQDTYHKGTDYYRGRGAYRCAFETPDVPNTTVHFETEGFYGTGEVWLNGQRLGAIDGEYLGISVDLTQHLSPAGKPNILALRLTNRCPNHILPGIKDPDFILHGGLSGRAWLRLRPHVHLVDDSTTVACGNPLAELTTLAVTTTLRNGGASPRSGQLHWCLLDPEGDCVAAMEPAALTVNPGQTAAPALTLSVPNPTLWSLNTPFLYRLVGTLTVDGETADTQVIPHGFRQAEFRPRDGFYLNGERTPLRGCNRHESMPGFGRALPPALHTLDAETIKEHGLNFVRLSHYPQHPAFLDACDRLGLLVYAELASWKSVRGYGRWLRSATRQFERMIRRDRHHPSVILWGMGNEAQSHRAYRKLRDVAKSLDPVRPVIYAENHFYRARRTRTPGIPDVWGVNYELDAIPDGLDASRSHCVVVSECSNEPHTRRGNIEAETRQIRTLDHDLSHLDNRAGVAGWTLWCYNDYATLRKGRYRRFSGIVDAWRVPKLAAAWLKARYDDSSFVRIAGNWGHDGDETRKVIVISNGENTRLTCGGQTVAAFSEKGLRELDLPYSPGPLVAETVRAGKRAHDTLFPFGAARRVVLDCAEGPMGDAHSRHDRGSRDPSTPPEPLRGSGSAPNDTRVHAHEPTGFCLWFPQDDSRTELIVLAVRVVDAAGYTITTWNGHVTLKVTDPARTHTLRPDGRIPLEAGLARTCLTVSGEHGSFSVRAEADGLQAANIDVDLASFQVGVAKDTP